MTWQQNRDHASSSDCAVEVDIPAHGARQIARDRQAKSNPRIFARCPTVYLEERLEDLGDLLRWDTDAGVADRHCDVIVAARRRQSDASAGRSELDRVADNVQQDLPQLQLIR